MKKIAITTCLLLTILSHLYALPEGVTFSIRYFDKALYAPGDTITVRATVMNDSPVRYRFRMAQSRVFNIEFIVSTTANRELPHAQNFIIERTSNQPVFFRDVLIEPGESFSFIENLSEFVSIEVPGAYYLKAVFYPELSTGPSPERAESNVLPLYIGSPEAVAAAETQETAAPFAPSLERESIPPDEVVAETIRARQRGQWDRFFLYLDLEGLLLRDPERARTYRRVSQAEQQRMLDAFAEALTRQTVDGDIVLSPNEFQIIKTTYTPDEGTVQVIERFANPDFTEVRLYTYYLHRRDEYWLIYNYTVSNLGTE